MTRDDDLTAAALELLAAGLDPTASTDDFKDAVIRLVEVIEIGGKQYLDAERFHTTMQAVIERARDLIPSSDHDTERVLDEAFERIAAQADKLTAPRPRH